MFIVNSYSLAVLFCFITMMCWGSWGNTQKLASKSWRYELFYWDYVIGMVLFTLVAGFTMGSFGTEGRSFLPDLAQADARGVWSVVLGGVIFNASNILLSASVAMAGLSVAFPLGVGLALVLGVVVNYVGAPKGDRHPLSGRGAHRGGDRLQRDRLAACAERRRAAHAVPPRASRWRRWPVC